MNHDCIRKKAEEREEIQLSPLAAKSSRAERRLPEAPCPFRTAFQRDRDRIIHTKAFRRLAYKTQVFINPAGDHYRSRLTHTLEVGQIARTLAKALNLNEDLAEAISLGHDLGHPPFGHSGERVLNRLRPGGFTHQAQSLRIVDKLAKDGRGLNLTREVRDGIIKHSKGRGPIFAPDGGPDTLEGQLVRVSDIIAYLAHDLDDAFRAGLLRPEAVPDDLTETFGLRGSTRIGAMVGDLLANSRQEGDKLKLAFSAKMEEAMNQLREFLFQRVYQAENLVSNLNKADRIIEDLYLCFVGDPKFLAKYYPAAGSASAYPAEAHGPDWGLAAGDFISGMTDRYALQLYQDIFWPQCWPVEH